MTVIVTDHHEVQEELPPAQVIVNPRQTDCPYPFKKLCGAAVAWKLVGELWRQMKLPMAALYDDLLMFAGFATVGDVMDLNWRKPDSGAGRVKTAAHDDASGMSALIEVNELARDTLSAFHIGFVLGPCINASGRLATAKRALELLDTEEQDLALERAAELKHLNDERKELTEQGLTQAVDLIEHSSLTDDRVLVVYLPDCHESLAGIIAGRIRERYYRPVFVLTRAEDGVKGSGRSIETYSMFEEMSKCKELYTKYGGHPMAAGVSMPEEHVELFRQRLNELCTLTEEELTEVIHIDMALPFSYVSEAAGRRVILVGTFRKRKTQNPSLRRGMCRCWNPGVLGKNQNVLRMKLMDESGTTLEGILFS